MEAVFSHECFYETLYTENYLQSTTTSAAKRRTRIIFKVPYNSEGMIIVSFCVQFQYKTNSKATNPHRIFIDGRRPHKDGKLWSGRVNTSFLSETSSFQNFERTITLKGGTDKYQVRYLTVIHFFIHFINVYAR